MVFRFLFVLLFVLVSNCSNTEFKEEINKDKDVLEVEMLYSISKNKKKKLNLRLNAINSAYKILKNKEIDSVLSKVLYQKALLHYSNKEYDSMLYFNDILINSSKFKNEHYYLGNANFLNAFYFDDIKYVPERAFYFYNQAKNHFKRISDSSEVGKCLLNLAYLQNNSNDYFGSKESVTQALQYLNADKDKSNFTSAYNVLAISNKELLNYNEAIKYYKKAIALTNSEMSKLNYKINISVVHTANKKYSEAIKLLKSLKNDTLLLTSPLKKARVIDHLAYNEWLKDSINTSKDLFAALEIREKYNIPTALIPSYKHLGEFFIKKNKAKASEYLEKAIEVSKLVKYPKGELEALRLLMELKPNNVALKNRYIYLSDSLKRQELNVKTQFAHIKYQDQQKTEQLLQQTNLAKQREIALLKEKEQKNIFIFAGIIFLLITLFYLKFQSVKYKNDKIESVYKTREALSKTIHDEVANEINLLTNYVENHSNSPMSSGENLLSNKLNNIYQRARNISASNNKIDFSNFKEELNNLLVQYNPTNIQLITNLVEFEWQSIANYKKGEIYLVLQELLVNAKKHSNASIITLILGDNNKQRTITYNDNGDGADLNKERLNGLKNAENRIKNIKGVFNFETSPGKGFQATIVFKK
ncbi:hypothetical protein PW52_01485 [Tamlana sedimentorum]|uniref:Uncharacterized protein n=1 Tax=Neotamlana sedimentorum TaxID=1435349 RepID=A0A0D7WDB1_9FLAO|nr:ATP-binding protein [Tamlana sedimentorum]KJD37155.1 hypothetical protein PW52_01485 [Tamlana sedimentorum]